ncbi:MAG TPA: SprT family zinc-dependent metalloprotease [Salinivirga sp.]|uniref:M48 family metallopeptidase n=1 Tax=Salinivirga sp. TaxID=1970192 RepID=UPI002B48AD64|nr:SprT family zinc-dependent metalloprotease [Salinivirga sp.]HKK60855.1 SprT family zinc-dependent metalloprotease [Salinivirga sp.]
MKAKYYYLEDKEIGKIKIVPKSGLKNFNIRLKPFDIVTISSPTSASQKQIARVIERKKKWILEKQAYNKTIEQKRTVFEHQTTIETFFNQFTIQQNDTDRLRLMGKKPEYVIAVPQKIDIKNPAFQQGIKNIIDFVLKDEASKYLPKRTQELANQFKFRYNNLSFRNNKTRWGSCSTKGNINLNIQLMRLPARMIDYVIIHELCHTIHPNHGSGFKKLLYSIMPEAPHIEKEMKNYRTQIY